ncbi:MAG: NAD(P)H-hydrate dehydratase [Deltaproteobacteria bacterium]|nr:NAD(P)H-hydrate dehydratase [Deltaproteobacteria bacterium]
MKVAGVEQMRAMDHRAMAELGIAEEILMENAGHAAVSVLARGVGIRDKKIAVFCGIGNNGGDGFVAARLIHAGGGQAQVFIIGDSEKYKGAAKTNRRILSKLPIDVVAVDSVEQVCHAVSHCDGIIDALFGTGLDRDVGGPAADVIRLVNRSGKRILSLDIPSGVNGDTGRMMGCAVKADDTVAFGLPKIGNLLYPGYGCCGSLYCSHISFPPSLYDDGAVKVATNDYLHLPPRDRSAHKGSMGEALFIAGAAGYFGAPYFAAMSFLKAGGGYSRLAAPASVAAVVAVKGSEIVFIPQAETGAGSTALENRGRLFDLAEKMDMVVIGPGLSLHPETQQLVRELAGSITKPLIIDGDGLTAVVQDRAVIKRRQAPTILTPHPGEMSKLTGRPIAGVEENRITVLQQTAQEWGALIVLKGAHSLIGLPDGRIFINLSGNAGMATAGSGDVLTGAVAAMYGLGLPAEDAVRKGVYIHGMAGDLAAAATGEDGMTAQDVLDHLPAAMDCDREKGAAYFAERYAVPLVV